MLGGPGLRLRARLRARRLDAELANGVDPVSSDLLSARAAQLQARRTRHRLATGMRGAVELSNRPPQAFSSALSIRRAETQACQSLLTALADRLDEDGPLGVQGLAIASVLISDGGSPMYREGTAPLTGTVHAALVALELREQGGVTGPG